tara:strand:- start:299 stop:643 length:345 start_codon:yes stop_codon:yes gene_type:complete
MVSSLTEQLVRIFRIAPIDDRFRFLQPDASAHEILNQGNQLRMRRIPEQSGIVSDEVAHQNVVITLRSSVDAITQVRVLTHPVKCVSTGLDFLRCEQIAEQDESARIQVITLGS